MKYLILCLFAFLSFPVLQAQNSVSGRVTELGENKEEKPLPFVNVYWSGTSHGTLTDENG